MTALCLLLQQARKAKKMSQEAAGKALGCSTVMICKIENGTAPNIEFLEKMIDVYSAPEEEIMRAYKHDHLQKLKRAAIKAINENRISDCLKLMQFIAL